MFIDPTNPGNPQIPTMTTWLTVYNGLRMPGSITTLAQPNTLVIECCLPWPWDDHGTIEAWA